MLVRRALRLCLIGSSNNQPAAAAPANVREAANMVPLDWRTSDLERAVSFYAPLLPDVGVLKATTDDLLKAVDIKIFKELSTSSRSKRRRRKRGQVSRGAWAARAAMF